MKKLIVLPFYNKAEIIKAALSKLYKCISPDTGIFVIDDGSEDGSKDLEYDEGVHCVFHEKPLGYGGCMISALDFAQENNIEQLIFLDISQDDFDKVYMQIEEYPDDYDILNCSRILPKKDSTFSQSDYTNLYLSNQIADKVNSITEYNLADMFSPFKSLKLPSLEKLTLEEFDEAIVIQLFIQTAHFELEVKEFHSEYVAIDNYNEQDNLEKEVDYYLNFIEGEKILYPV